MYCENCGSEIPEGASFCSNCGHKIKKTHHKNIYLALVLSFILSGLGSVYAGNTQKGLVIIALRILFAALAVFVNVFMVFTILVWAYGFYAAYQDDHEAQYQLGRCYEKGIGGVVNRKKSLAWYKLSSENGNKKAGKAIKQLNRRRKK